MAKSPTTPIEATDADAASPGAAAKPSSPKPVKAKPMKAKPGPLADLPAGVHEVSITDIVQDPKYQARLDGTDEGRVKQYATAMRAGVVFPPVTLARVDGQALLVAGWHRIEACKMAGIGAIQAEIKDRTASEAMWEATSSNLTHGKGASRAEKRLAFKAFIRARKHIRPGSGGAYLTYQEMAKALGGIGSPVTVWNWMQADFPKLAEKLSHGELGQRRPEATRDTEAGYFRAAMGAVREIEAQMRAVRTPSRRIEVWEAVEALRTALAASVGDEFDTPQ